MAAMQANNRTINQGELDGYNNGEYQFNDIHGGNANSISMEHTNAVDYDTGYESITVGYFPEIPTLIFHPVLNMYSEPALTQTEYEDVVVTKQQAEALGTAINAKAVAQRLQLSLAHFLIMHLTPHQHTPKISPITLVAIIYKHEAGTDLYSELVSWNHLDEIIAVTCSNEPTSTIYRFEIAKSALERSPVLAEFFKSFDYLYGCGMMLTFPEDLAVCFHVVKEYVEKGPDIYNEATLKTYATVGNAAPGGATVETFTFLVRLHKLATKLELRSLTDMTLVVLHQVELSMTPRSCTALTGLVFKDEPFGFQDIIKAFVINHIENYFEDLHRSRDWNHVVATTSNDFQVKWARMVIAHYELHVSYGIDTNIDRLLGESANINTRLAQLFHKADEAEVAFKTRLNESIRLNGERSARSSFDTTVTAIHDRIDEASDEEDPTTPKASETNGESSNSLGVPVVERSSLSTEYPRPFWQVDAKARRLLGMNNDGGGVIAGRIRPSGLSKARKSLNDFMRSS